MTGVLQRLAAAAAWRGAEPACFEGRRALSYGALAEAVRRAAAGLARQPDRIAIAAEEGLAFTTALLAAVAAGKMVVPVPLFFSPDQVGHLLRDAEIEAAIVDEGGRALLAGQVPRLLSLEDLEGAEATDRTQRARRLLYTSGTSGTPKGVLLEEWQIAAVAERLALAIGSFATDRHLSLLPLSMLLESLVAIEMVIRAAASVRFAPQATEALFSGEAGPALELMGSFRPTTTVLVPRQLEALLAQAREATAFPTSLRCLAVGGAPVALALQREAIRRGIPLCVGYGLTECGSVVALTRPGEAAEGTVGRVLPGLEVRILEGEIVVAGPTVMSGYLGEPPLRKPIWWTGDLGRFDEMGRLILLGRKDDLLVTGQGRSLSPGWIEETIGAVEGVVRSLVTLDSKGDLLAVVELAEGEGETAAEELCRAAERLPSYARPSYWLLRPAGFLFSCGLLSAAGKPLRAAARRRFAAESAIAS